MPDERGECMRNEKNIRNIRKGNRVRKILLMVVFTLLLFGGCSKDVKADVIGMGTRNNPYIVNDFEGLNYALTKGKAALGETYIGISGTVIMEKNIDVDGGSFYIYAYEEGASIIKSTKESDKINDKLNPKYCLRVGRTKDTIVEMGCQGQETLILDGQREYYENNNMISSGWLYVGEYATVNLGSKVYVRNMINNDEDSRLSNISVYGSLMVDCHIDNCRSLNGGAICAKGQGEVSIYENAIIENCRADTEGGAIWIKDKSKLVMYDGTIRKNISAEEGGGIFVSGREVTAEIINGNICENQAGQSAGGIFSGYGATLIVGSKDGEGCPVIERNVATGSGGGIRPNGGTTAEAGGKFYFYSGVVKDNVSGKYGGGIGIGAPGADGIGIVHIENAQINNNAAITGGGIYLSKGNTGIDGDVKICNSRINENNSEVNAGGIFINSNLKLSMNDIIYNNAAQNGGGIYIESNGNVTSDAGNIRENGCEKYGAGVYLKGTFKIGGNACIEENEVYLCKEKYVEVYEIFTYDSELYLTIDSAAKKNGTKLIYVTYSGGTGEKLLYGNGTGENDEYENPGIRKYIQHMNLTDNKIVRSAGKIDSIGDSWIIISSSYKIIYDKNTDEQVADMPQSQIKFYAENTSVSEKLPRRDGYEVDVNSSWNVKQNGDGQVYLPGSEYGKNKDLTLYIVWKKILVITINTKDRYYVVGQDIELNESEILRKVEIFDNVESGYNYETGIKKIVDLSEDEILYDDSLGLPENSLNQYLSTEVGKIYELTVFTENKSENKQSEKTMRVHICEEKNNLRYIRFISYDYLDTLKVTSPWNALENKMILQKALGNEVKNKWRFSSQDIVDMKKYIEEKSYAESANINNSFYQQFMKGEIG